MKSYSAIQQENLRLKNALEVAKKKNVDQEQNMERLREQVDILKYSNVAMNESEKKDFEKRINTYLKEIDKCIVMLSQ